MIHPTATTVVITAGSQPIFARSFIPQPPAPIITGTAGVARGEKKAVIEPIMHSIMGPMGFAPMDLQIMMYRGTKMEQMLTQYNHMNVLSMHALMAAYSPEGDEWVDELCQVLEGNIDFACRYIADHFDGVKVSKPESTYMLFVDCTEWCEKHGKAIGEVEKAAWNVGVAIQDGRAFYGPCHIRMNLALPLSRVQEAFDRLDKYVFNGSL